MLCNERKGQLDSTDDAQERSLEQIKEDHINVETANYTVQAKQTHHSVSHKPFFDIPLEQVRYKFLSPFCFPIIIYLIYA